MNAVQPNIQMILIASIDVPKRIRAVSHGHVDQLASEIAEAGLGHAITVRPMADDRFELVAGAHRLAAMVKLGFATIPADVRAMTDQQARLWQLTENLARHELNPKDRMVFLLEAKRLRQQIDPAAKRGGDRKSIKVHNVDFDLPFAKTFTDEMAEKIGIRRARIFEDIATAERLEAAGVLDMLDGTALVHKRTDLVKLSKEPAAKQRNFIREFQDGGAKTLSAARVATGHDSAVDPEQARRNARIRALVKAWVALDEDSRVEAITNIIGDRVSRAEFCGVVSTVLGTEIK